MSGTAAQLKPQPSTKPRFSLAVKVLLTAGALALWFWTQHLIGARKLNGLLIGDGLHALTAPWNAYLQLHPGAANALLIVSSGIIDLLGVYLLLKWIIGKSVRPFLGLILVLGLRQVMQALVALPAPPNDLWHYPGFPSLLVTYTVANDFFYSGHTAIAVFAATELWREGKRWLQWAAILIPVFEITIVIVLRAHYTMDVFTGLVTALLVAIAADRLALKVDR
jgi:hypothetical protein